MSGEEQERKKIVRFSTGGEVRGLERLERVLGPVLIVDVVQPMPPSASAVLDKMVEHDADFVMLDFSTQVLGSTFIGIAAILEVICGEVILPNIDEGYNFLGYRLLEKAFAASVI